MNATLDPKYDQSVLQKRDHWCAPAALQTALQIYGCHVGQVRLARLMGTTTEGSDEQDIHRALGVLGFGHQPFESDHKTNALRWLFSTCAAAPVLLCVDGWEHWICVAGRCGDRLWVFDPAPSPFCSPMALTPKTIEKRWCTSKKIRNEGPKYFGIAVTQTDYRLFRAR